MYCTLYSRGQCVSIDADGVGRIVFEASANQIAETLRIGAFGRNRLLKVTIEFEDE
jgi:hypothetical protein